MRSRREAARAGLNRRLARARPVEQAAPQHAAPAQRAAREPEREEPRRNER